MGKRGEKKEVCPMSKPHLWPRCPVTEKAKHLFESNNVLSHVELEARHEIELEKYVKKVQIEARIMGELCTSHILPRPSNIRIHSYKTSSNEGNRLKEPAFSNQKQILEKISEHISEISSQVSKMIDARKKSQCADRFTRKGDCLLR